MERFAFQDALIEVMKAVSRSNKYIDETAPWVLGKDDSKKDRLATVLYNLLETIRIAGILLTPFMPDSCKKIQEMIGADNNAFSWESAARFGGLCPTATVHKGENLFPRIDLNKELEALEAAKAAKEAAAQKEKKAPQKEEKPEGVVSLIGIDDFAKVQLRVAQVTACEPVPKSDKLLCLQLDDGMGGRQVVSGIHAWYEPADLIGKKIVLVANLQPAKLRGTLSNGMILAADVGDTAKVIFVDDSIPNGANIR